MDQQRPHVLQIRAMRLGLPVDRTLARFYTYVTINIRLVLTILDRLSGCTSAEELCQYNRAAAAKVGRKDLVQLWTLMGNITHPTLFPAARSCRSLQSPNDALSRLRYSKSSVKDLSMGDGDDEVSPDLDTEVANPSDMDPWHYHPFARPLLTDLFKYYQRLGDVQTLAMLSCVLAFSSAPLPSPPLSAPAPQPPAPAPPTKERTKLFSGGFGMALAKRKPVVPPKMQTPLTASAPPSTQSSSPPSLYGSISYAQEFTDAHKLVSDSSFVVAVNKTLIFFLLRSILPTLQM